MSIQKRFATLILALITVAGLAACKPAETPDVDGDTTVETTEIITTAAETEPEPATSPEEIRLNQLLESRIELHFGDDGKFRIMALSDLHIPVGGIPEEGMARVRQLVEKEKPDLIVLVGDNLMGDFNDEDTFREALGSLVDYFEEQDIYWMHVYGNHDPEMGVSLEQQQAIYESYEHCLSKDPDKELTGVGNYVLPIYGSDSDEVKFLVWGIDSNSNLTEADKQALFPLNSTTFKGYDTVKYDYIHYDQIQWYHEASELIEEQFGRKVPGLMAFHIPLHETYAAWLNRRALEWEGEKGDTVSASAYNSGLFEILRGRGDVKAVVSGHDHLNNFMVNYAGIKLCYAGSVTTTSYGGTDTVRMFVLDESNPADIHTYNSSFVRDE